MGYLEALYKFALEFKPLNNVAIGIGTLKNVYKKPFEYAGISELKKQFQS